MPERADVVVVGGGIVGAASAYRLACRGLSVVLLEQGEIAGAQSGRNWGFVRQQGRAPAEIPLMAASNRMWPLLAAELEADIDWVQGGNLALAADEATAARFRAWAAVGAEHGVETRSLGMREIRELLPGVQREWVAGMFTASDGHADPVKTTTAFARAAAARGAEIRTGCLVERILVSNGRVSGVAAGGGEVAAASVVCAAGVSSRALLATVGLDLPLQRARTTVAATEPAEPLTRAGAWEPGGLAVRQAPDGRLVIARGGLVEVDVTLDLLSDFRSFVPLYWRNRKKIRLRVGPALLRDAGDRLRRARPSTAPPPEATPAARDVEVSLHELGQWFPHLRGIAIERTWAGTIDGTPDFVPVIEALEAPAGLVVATGFSGHGFAMGPMVGTVVADLVTEGRNELDLTPMRLSRFAEGDFAQPSAL